MSTFPTREKKISRSLISRISWPAKLALIALLGMTVALGVGWFNGPTTIQTATGAAVAQSVNEGSVAVADNSDDMTTDPASGIMERKTVAIRACPQNTDGWDAMPQDIKDKAEGCTEEQKALWEKMVSLGGGTPRSEQVKLANTGSLLEATSYLPISTWSTEIGTFSSAPDLKGFEWSSMISNLIGFIAGWIVAMVGYLWMGLMFIVALAFSADIATRAISFIDFMTAWISSLLTSSTGAMIAVVPMILVAALAVQFIALLFPGAGGKIIGTTSGNASAFSNIRSVVINIGLSVMAFAFFVLIGSQAQKNHQMGPSGISKDLTASERSAIGNYISTNATTTDYVDGIVQDSGVGTLQVQNSIASDIPISALKEPNNWAAMSPGWILGNLFKVINWATAQVVTIPLTLAQATNETRLSSGDVNSCSVYIDGKRGLFLATPASNTYELASNLMVSMDILFQRLVLDPYSIAAFGGGGSGQSAYCRVLESASGTSTGEQILAMRASGLYGAIVGTGGMGTVGGEGSSDIVAPGNPWKKVSVEPSGGTLLDAGGNPVMLTTYDQYAVQNSSDDKSSAAGSFADNLRDSSNKVGEIAGDALDFGKTVFGLVTGDDEAVNKVGEVVGETAKGAATGALKELGTEETIQDTTKEDSSISTGMDIGGGTMDYSASMTALQRIFGPGIVNTDGQFEALAYFAACRPVVGTKTLNLAGAWVGAEQAEPQQGAGELTAENCLSDSIIGPYSNGGFGGGSEEKENAVEGGADQKAWLYKPRDSDNKRTNLFGFNIGDDTNDKSSIAKLGKARGNVLRSNEAVEFYQSTSGNLTWKVFITVAVIVTGIWVVYRYIGKVLIGALFAGFLLIGAALAAVLSLVGMIIPMSATRRFARTSGMSVISAASASAFVSIILVTIVALSRVFEFMLLGAVGYVLEGGSTLFTTLEPLLVLLTVVGAAVLVEKGTKKFFGGPSITSWSAVGALGGMAMQPLRNLTDPGEQAMFHGYNGKNYLDTGFDAAKKGGSNIKDRFKEILGDEDVVSDDSKPFSMSYLDDKSVSDTVDADGNPIENEDDPDDEHTTLANSASSVVSLLKGEDEENVQTSTRSAHDQNRLANTLTGEDYDATAALENDRHAYADDDQIEQAASDAGAFQSPGDEPTSAERIMNMSRRATPDDFSRLNLGEGAWSDNAPTFDLESANELYTQALANMHNSAQDSANSMATRFSEAMGSQSEELSRMAGSVELDTSSIAQVQEAVRDYGRSANTLSQGLTLTTSDGISAMLDSSAVEGILNQARAGSQEMVTMMRNQIVSATGPAMQEFNSQLAAGLATATSDAIIAVTPGMTSAIARPMAASMIIQIQQEIDATLQAEMSRPTRHP